MGHHAAMDAREQHADDRAAELGTSVARGAEIRPGAETQPPASLPSASATQRRFAADRVIRPMRTLWLLAVAHAVNHAQAVLLPLVYLKVIDEFHVTIETIAFLSAFGSISSGAVQLSYASLTRYVSRRRLLGIGGLLFGGGFAAQALAGGFPLFAATNVASRLGGSPQHPVGNGLLAEQFPPERRGFAISAHIAGGNVGTVVVALVGAGLIASIGWRGAVVVFGLPAIVIALLILAVVRESGTDRDAAIAHGSVRSAFGTILRDRDLRWLYLTSVLGGGGRGLGVVNLFALIYLTKVIGLDESTSGLMYGALIVLSVPTPLVAGWLSDRLGRKPLIIGVYLGGAVGFVVFLLAGSGLLGLWAGIAIMGLFSFAESPQLQALLADIAPVEIRDVAFALYFTLAFGVGSLWIALYGAIIEAAGNATGLPIVFGLMAATFLLAALATVPIRDRGRVLGGDEAGVINASA
jgi:MFS transporter, FSR family, fosmidomycin resistance protein